MREKVLEILSDIRPDIDFETETGLITNEQLASFDIITIVGELSDEFGIEISPKDLVAENFNSLDAIVSLVERLENE